MNYFLGGAQPPDAAGYWLKPHEHADVAHFILLDGTVSMRTACGKYIPKSSAIQGRRGVRLCEACLARVRAQIILLRKRKVRNGANLG